MAFVGQRVPGDRFLQLRDGADVAGMQLRHVDQRLALHGGDLGESFRDAFVDVVGLSFGRQHSGIHAEQRDPSGKRIRKRLEDKCGERFVVRDLAL